MKVFQAQKNQHKEVKYDSVTCDFRHMIDVYSFFLFFFFFFGPFQTVQL